MIIKSKGIKSSIILLFGFLIIYFFIMYDLSKSILFSAILFLVLSIILLLIWFVYDKTIIMDISGITVHFLFYKKSYSWDDVKTIRIVNLKRCYEFGRFFHRCAYFSFKKNIKFRLINPSTYGNLHPFSFGFIYFKKSEEKLSTQIYEIDEQLFISKLDEWGIKIEES